MMFELRVSSYELRVSRDATHRRSAQLTTRNSQLVPRSAQLATRNSQLTPSGLTLIELLITITIIATLATLFLGASNAAMEAAHAARTKTTIHKIHTLLMERWGSYTTRRVEIKKNIKDVIEQDYRNKAIDSAERGRQLADARLNALRELMRLEMPDRWSDITGAPVDQSPIYPGAYPVAIDDRPSLTKAYLRRYESLTGDPRTIEGAEGAECLYMIIMLGTGDGEARTLFSRQDIGDTDNDGAPEFLDGWGRPIHFVRWPAGFVSDLQPLDPVTNSRSADKDHDPFDFFRRQPEAYRLVPLVFSNGSDGDSDIHVPREEDIDEEPNSFLRLDPYTAVFNGEQLAVQGDRDGDGEGWHDNIHNHLLDNR